MKLCFQLQYICEDITEVRLNHGDQLTPEQHLELLRITEILEGIMDNVCSCEEEPDSV
jgi:hypothetical protein